VTLPDLEESEDCLQDALDMFYPNFCEDAGTLDESIPSPFQQLQKQSSQAALPKPDCSLPLSRKRKKIGRPRGDELEFAQGTDTLFKEDGLRPVQRRGRGPKPKYIYKSKEEAAGARRERNRKAALESYYKRRNRMEEVEREMERLQAENASLELLLSQIESGSFASKESVSTDEGIDDWLAAKGC